MVSADGGVPATLTESDEAQDEYAHRLPHWLPGGNKLLFTIMGNDHDLNPRVALLEMESRKWHPLLDDGADARYVPTGHIVFLRRGVLMAVPFDPVTLEVKGQPVPIIEDVMQALNFTNRNYVTAGGQFSISDTGSLIYAIGGVTPDLENELVWVDHGGSAQPITSFKAHFNAPRLSPDRRRIAITTIGANNQVWIYDLVRDFPRPLVGEGYGGFVNWTSKGENLIFDCLGSGSRIFNLHRQGVDGSQPMQRLIMSEHAQFGGSCHRDGTTFAFVQSNPDTGSDILLLDLQTLQVKPFLNSHYHEEYPEFSPDGRWMAYTSGKSGCREVYVTRFPSREDEEQISSEGGEEPLWGRNGKQLFYRRHEQNDVWSVDLNLGEYPPASKPRLLFRQSGYREGIPNNAWDLSPKGQRFIMVKIEDRITRVTEMILVQNWFEGLKQKVPNER
jgi:serine/threonine-protein kinase